MTHQVQNIRPGGFQYNAPVEQVRPALPPQNTGWAVAALLFFWPLAFSAFSHSAKVYPLWAMGDSAGAQAASDSAKRLGRIALLVWAVLVVLIVVLYVAIFAAAMSAVNDLPTYSDYSYR
ncbi:CD225/dispanin family protein [Rhodococcus zopfii]|uniref:CD225/dispanin family protein n=1 Tax=Rhodococcus zopfii TaxID=43772 RepID=UPI00364D41B6